MKKYLVILLISFFSISAFCQGQFKIRNDQYIQIGYNGYKALTFGQSTGSPNNGNFAIEHCIGCNPSGLNIWKPWPTSGAANYLMFIRDDGNIGIGNTGDALYKLNVSGPIRATSFITFSDTRFKQKMTSLSNTLDGLSKIKSYSYYYKTKKRIDVDSLNINVLKTNAPYYLDDALHIGYSAQEVMKVYPHLVTEDENGYLNVNYIEFIPIISTAVIELNGKIKELESVIASLKNK